MYLKRGDSLICKKTYKDIDGRVLLYNGNMYLIFNIYNFIIDIVCDNSPTYDNLMNFTLNRDDCFFRYLWDYFYTKKELRKLKLNKLEDI